jgi:hypothetical protein
MALAQAASAQSVLDPTQPPSSHATRVTAGAAVTGADTAASRDQRLQMVIRGPGEKRRAVIGGRVVGVGDAVDLDGGSARVLAIHDDKVVLVRGTARETLDLLPDLKNEPRGR